MHELLLFAQIPSQNHQHLLKILAGITAMQPLTLIEHHLVFKPIRPPSTTAAAAAAAAARPAKHGGPAQQVSQSTDLFYVQLVGHLSQDAPAPASGGGGSGVEGQERSEGKTGGKVEKGKIDFNAHPWTLEFRDLPEVQGRRTVTARLMSSVPVTAGDPVRFVEAMGYKYMTSYVQTGHQFTHNTTSIRLTQTIPLPLASSPSSSSAPPVPTPAPKNLSSLSRLDPSGTYLLQASVRVQDGSNPDVMAKGMAELGQLREMLKGIVDLEVAERLALDPRVR